MKMKPLVERQNAPTTTGIETMTKTTDATKRDYLVVWCPPNKGAAQTYREGCGHLARRCDNRAQAERIAHTLNYETRGHLGHYEVVAA
jgi:hypothetical protein